MNRTGSWFRRLTLCALLGSTASGWAIATAPYDSLNGAQFDQFILRLKAEPSLFHSI